MTRRWDAINARARGLQVHLCAAHDFERLAAAPDLPALADALRAAGFPVTDADRFSPSALELAVRRRAGTQLSVLSRWAGPRLDALALLFDDEERLSIRAMLRGAAAGAPASERLAGTLPTRALPERALEELARQPGPRAVVALLSAWRHPAAPSLVAALGSGEADLYRLELALGRHYAARATRLARGRSLREFARETIDVDNALAALALAERPADVTPKDVFLPDGNRVTIGAFEEAIATRTAAGAAHRLARALGPSPLAHALERSGGDVGVAHSALLRARLAAQRQAARREPLGPAPLLAFVLGLRTEVGELRQLIWGTALGAPRAA